MPRRRDPVWDDHLKKKVDGRWECKHCGKTFAPNVALSRITSHLFGVPEKGAELCRNRPAELCEEANKRRRIMPSVPIHNQGQDSVSQAMEVDTAPTPEQSERPGILEQPQAPENPSALAQTFSNLSLTAEELERLNGLSTPEWESIYAALITSSTGIEGRGGHVQATPAADVLEQPRAPENLSLEENRYNAPEIPPIPADKDALNTLGENTADQMQHVTITPRSSNNDENARQADDRDPLEEHHQVPHAPPSSSNEEASRLSQAKENTDIPPSPDS
ncbi:hypothetical protein Tsubulata_038414 [Turnera subulata]|uniref:BED-type domain-containing protein n=1 Tax=Turnera subulata TaxID=218843 RepID=A0A9Q0FFQ4_9ROSI|nr:hypothetical protein Tsubulata_038414 [Turnera subulata]